MTIGPRYRWERLLTSHCPVPSEMARCAPALAWLALHADQRIAPQAAAGFSWALVPRSEGPAQ